MKHWRLDKPVSRQQDIGLGGRGLRQLKEHASRLGQALGRVEDNVLQVAR